MSAAEAANTTPDEHRLVVEDLTKAICRLLPDGRFTYVNEVYCRLFGKAREELLGKTGSSGKLVRRSGAGEYVF